MELSSIYHRPESEFAYLYDQENIHLRLRSKRGDLSKVRVVFQDPFLTEQDETELTLVAETSIFDFWQVQVTVPYRRLMYYFVLEDSQGQIMAYGTLITLPVLIIFVLFQRSFVASLAGTAVKG